jgi:flagellar basal body-associated protein FliL
LAKTCFEEESAEAQWQPGFMKRLPIIGIVALTTILICAGGAVAVLLVSDGKTEQAWAHRAGIKPSVLLSACNAVANLALSLAIAEAVAIAWWRKALKGSTV